MMTVRCEGLRMGGTEGREKESKEKKKEDREITETEIDLQENNEKMCE